MAIIEIELPPLSSTSRQCRTKQFGLLHRSGQTQRAKAAGAGDDAELDTAPDMMAGGKVRTLSSTSVQDG